MIVACPAPERMQALLFIVAGRVLAFLGLARGRRGEAGPVGSRAAIMSESLAAFSGGSRWPGGRHAWERKDEGWWFVAGT